MEKKKIIISLNDVLFFFLIFFCTAANSSMGNKMQLVLAIVLIVLCSQKVNRNFYFVFESSFIIYIFFQLVLGIAEDQVSTVSALIQCIRVLIVTYATYCYLLYKRAKIQLYWYGVMSALILLVLLYRDSALNLRLSANNIIGIFGFSSSTMIALCCASPCFFLMFFNYKNNRKESLIISAFFLVVTILTGTRKVLVYFFLALVIIPYMYKGNVSKITISKIVKAVIISVIVSGIVMFMFINIPLLYKLIGNRIESAITFGAQNNDSSLRVRTLFIAKAMELFYERPILGFGMNYFHTISIYKGLYSHNNYTEILSGGGVVGLFLYYGRYLFLIHKILKFKKYKQRDALLLLSFLIIQMVLEYWQVAYIYANWLISHSIILATIEKGKYSTKELKK